MSVLVSVLLRSLLGDHCFEEATAERDTNSTRLLQMTLTRLADRGRISSQRGLKLDFGDRMREAEVGDTELRA
jgi:hypothetical protein